MTGERVLTQLGELSEKPEFQEAFSAVQSRQEALKLLSDYGVVVTEAELDEALQLVQADGEAELSPDALEDVTGGTAVTTAARIGLTVLRKVWTTMPVYPVKTLI